jgi:hypothetical protein
LSQEEWPARKFFKFKIQLMNKNLKFILAGIILTIIGLAIMLFPIEVPCGFDGYSCRTGSLEFAPNGTVLVTVKPLLIDALQYLMNKRIDVEYSRFSR